MDVKVFCSVQKLPFYPFGYNQIPRALGREAVPSTASPQLSASSPKSSRRCLSAPIRPHLLDSSLACSPWASLLLLEHIKPVPTAGPFLWLPFLSRYFMSMQTPGSFIHLFPSSAGPSLPILPRMSALSQHPHNSITGSLPLLALQALTSTGHTFIHLFTLYPWLDVSSRRARHFCSLFYPRLEW